MDQIPVEIYKLPSEETKISDISDKLKVLILLIIFQNNLGENKLDEAYLINPEWLRQYKYKKINLLIEENQEIQNLNLQSNDLKSVSKIISCLDKEKLNKLDKHINYIETDSTIQFDSPIEKLKLQDKYILIYKNFVLVDKQIALLLEKYFEEKFFQLNIFWYMEI